MRSLLQTVCLVSAGLFALALAVPRAADAGGFFLTEFGTEDVALAGAGWAARAQDASTLFKNPAGMSRLEGNHFQGGLQALYFQSSGFSGTNTPYGGNGGGNPIGVVPGMSGFYVHSLSKDFKVGLGMLGNFGLGLKYDQGFVGRYYVKQATLVGITFAPVASYRVHEQFSIGGGPNIMVGYLKTTANINDFPPTGAGAGELQVRSAVHIGTLGVEAVTETEHKTNGAVNLLGVAFYFPAMLRPL